MLFARSTRLLTVGRCSAPTNRNFGVFFPLQEAARVLVSSSSPGTHPDSKNQESGVRVPRVVSGATAPVRRGVIHAREGEVERGERGPAAAPKRRKLSKYSRRSS